MNFDDRSQTILFKVKLYKRLKFNNNTFALFFFVFCLSRYRSDVSYQQPDRFSQCQPFRKYLPHSHLHLDWFNII